MYQVNTNHTLIQELLDGSLMDEQAGLLLDEMAQSPELSREVLQHLDLSDLIDRALDPARSDTSVMSQLTANLDHIDGGDFGDGGDSGDSGDDGGAPPDSQGPDIGGSPDLPTDPGMPSGGLSTTAKIWTGAILAAGIGAGVAVMNRSEERAPTVKAVAPAVPIKTVSPDLDWIDIVAEADLELHKRNLEDPRGGNENFTLLVHGARRGLVRCQCLLRFDLSILPDDFERVELRLYPVHGDVGAKELNLSHSRYDNWDEDIGVENAPRVIGKPHVMWLPVVGETSVLEVTKLVAEEKARDGKITFVMKGQKHDEEEGGFLFYSRKYEAEALRPTLRVYFKAEEGGQ